MRKCPGLLHSAVLVCAFGAFAIDTGAEGQSLLGFGPVTGSNDFFVYKIDPRTGAFTRMTSIGDPFLVFGKPAFDPVGRRLFVLETAEQLVTLAVDTGAVTHETSLTVDGFLEYSVRARTLYGVGQPPGSGIADVFAFDPESHQWFTLTYFPDLSVGSTTLDDAGGRLFVLGGSSSGPRLAAVRLDSGETSTVQVAATAQGFQLQWDATAHLLLGVGTLSGDSSASLFSIDPVSGSFTRLEDLSESSIFTSTIDPPSRRLYFTSPPGTLSTLNLDSGAIVNAPIERCCPALFVGGFSAVSVPSLGGWAAFVLVAALALVGSRMVWPAG